MFVDRHWQTTNVDGVKDYFNIFLFVQSQNKIFVLSNSNKAWSFDIAKKTFDCDPFV